MGWLLKLLTFPVMGPVEGLVWVAEKIAEQAETDFYSEPAIKGKLLELEMRYDLGEISEEDFYAAEEALLQVLRTIRERNSVESEGDDEE
jgi:hypothetical protein